MKLKHTRHDNPFYEGAAVMVIEDPTTGRYQHFAVWPNTTVADFIRLARHHLAAVRQPLPAWREDGRLLMIPNRRKDDDSSWA